MNATMNNTTKTRIRLTQGREYYTLDGVAVTFVRECPRPRPPAWVDASKFDDVWFECAHANGLHEMFSPRDFGGMFPRVAVA